MRTFVAVAHIWAVMEQDGHSGVFRVVRRKKRPWDRCRSKGRGLCRALPSWPVALGANAPRGLGEVVAGAAGRVVRIGHHAADRVVWATRVASQSVPAQSATATTAAADPTTGRTATSAAVAATVTAVRGSTSVVACEDVVQQVAATVQRQHGRHHGQEHQALHRLVPSRRVFESWMMTARITPSPPGMSEPGVDDRTTRGWRHPLGWGAVFVAERLLPAWPPGPRTVCLKKGIV